MSSDETAVANLVHEYAQHVDAGDLDGAAGLLSGARIKWYPASGEEIIDAAYLLDYWRRVVILYEDGTPRTKHLITNLIIDVGAGGDHATCSSYYTVLQRTSGRTMDVILTGRYVDEFERSSQGWHFSSREYSPAEFVGDVSQHRRS